MSERSADPQALLGKYEILEHIASGRTTTIHKARLSGIGGFHRTVAIKQLLPTVARNEAFIGHLVDEAKVGGLLTHANVVQIFDLGQAEGGWYVAMEYVDGRDLGAVLRQARGRGLVVPVPHAVFVVIQLLKGLEYAHQRQMMKGKRAVALNILHRDLCPSNVLLSFSGEVKLTDFGAARASFRAGPTLDGNAGGTVAYCSPEQLAPTTDLDQRSDLFNVGVLLYELLTGHRPFEGATEAETINEVLSGTYRSASDRNPEIPFTLEAVVDRALEPEPQNRYRSATDFKDSLDQFFHDAGFIFTPATLSTYVRGLFPGAAGSPPSRAPAPRPPAWGIPTAPELTHGDETARKTSPGDAASWVRSNTAGQAGSTWGDALAPPGSSANDPDIVAHPRMTPEEKGALLLSWATTGAGVGGMDFSGVHLEQADLRQADLRGALLYDARLWRCDLDGADLEGARLRHAQLEASELGSANLSRAKLGSANLARVDLSYANLQGARLRYANLELANLQGADLRDAQLWSANLLGANLSDAYFAGAQVWGTRLLDVTLPQELVDDADVRSPTVDWRTIARSLHVRGLVDFLVRTGMPRATATQTVETLRSVDPEDRLRLLQSVFLSYGRPDEGFAERLRDQLTENGVHTWFFPRDAEPGRRLARHLQTKIHEFDRMILCCSAASLQREGVLHEVEEVLEREQDEGASEVLIPVLLEDIFASGRTPPDWWPADKPYIYRSLRRRVCPDFREAQHDPAQWNLEFDKLLRALRTQPSKGA